MIFCCGGLLIPLVIAASPFAVRATAQTTTVQESQPTAPVTQIGLPDPLEQALANKPVFDGRLSVHEIQRSWDLKAELVTLSACETALGRDLGGEGFVGVYAGRCHVWRCGVFVFPSGRWMTRRQHCSCSGLRQHAGPAQRTECATPEVRGPA